MTQPAPAQGAADEILARTARTLIRCVRPADLGPLYDIATDPAVAPMLLLFRPGMERDEFARIFPAGADRPPFRAAVETGGGVVGSIGVSAGPRPSIVYFLAPAVAGQGLASEIVPVFAALLGRRFGLTALRAEVFADNPASLRVLEKAGFVRTGPTLLRSAARSAARPGWMLERAGG